MSLLNIDYSLGIQYEIFGYIVETLRSIGTIFLYY